jgi:Swiss Army Knife RNA repair-like protein
MPVIFLDIDGVLNRKRLLGSTPRVIDPDLLERFKLLVRNTGAYVVLASTWRHDAAGIAAAREQGLPFDDLVPDLRPRSRGYEVKEWLRVHQNMGRFAVIDDDDDGYGSLPLFQPHPTEGITPEINAAVAAYLSGKTDRDFRRNVLVRALQLVRATLAGHRG